MRRAVARDFDAARIHPARGCVEVQSRLKTRYSVFLWGDAVGQSLGSGHWGEFESRREEQCGLARMIFSPVSAGRGEHDAFVIAGGLDHVGYCCRSP